MAQQKEPSRLLDGERKRAQDLLPKAKRRREQRENDLKRCSLDSPEKGIEGCKGCTSKGSLCGDEKRRFAFTTKKEIKLGLEVTQLKRSKIAKPINIQYLLFIEL